MLSNLAIGPAVDAAGFNPVFAVSAILYPVAWLIIAGPWFVKKGSA
jgi:hypothetical protein